jgi:ATP-dependent Clp protease ATP-binding subunit ClpB
LKRAVQRELETPIAKGILAGSFSSGHTIFVDVTTDADQGKLRFQQRELVPAAVLA